MNTVQAYDVVIVLRVGRLVFEFNMNEALSWPCHVCVASRSAVPQPHLLVDLERTGDGMVGQKRWRTWRLGTGGAFFAAY